MDSCLIKHMVDEAKEKEEPVLITVTQISPNMVTQKCYVTNYLVTKGTVVDEVVNIINGIYDGIIKEDLFQSMIKSRRVLRAPDETASLENQFYDLLSAEHNDEDYDDDDDELLKKFSGYQQWRRAILHKTDIISNNVSPSIIAHTQHDLTTQGILVAIEYETKYNFRFYLNVSPIDKTGTRITIHEEN